ncbi:hypothetical protein [Jannaschia sp. R86511]|uniref:hypothetical protein n=1 Tax=Jannaschia sp. R86511 TaxID=3093853 RepID=UPI0036D3667B
MSGADAGSSTRDGISLLMAALREDPVAVAVLLSGWDLEQSQHVAAFCAYLAAGQLKEAEVVHRRPGLYDAALREVALQLAASGRSSLSAE